MKPLFTLALLALPAFAAFPNGYTYCKVVTTQHAMVSGTSDLTNYPLTVILTDNDLRTAGNAGLVNNANGYDIGFYPDCSGSGAALKWEMESYSPSTGAIVAHVLRPTLSHTTDDTIGMFYGGSFSSFQSTVSAVWDANYKGVWHLPNGTSLSLLDSTSNANDLSNQGSATAAAGKIDGAVALNGSSQFLNKTAALVTAAPLTIEAWVYPTNVSAANAIPVAIGDSGSYTGWYLNVASGVVSFNTAQSESYGASVGGSLSNNIWAHIAGVSASANSRYVYTNGSPATEDTTNLTPSAGSLNLTNVGNWGLGSTNLYFPGRIDEVRISNTARSAAWILTEYRNQSAPVTYLSAGPRITGDGGGSRVRPTVRGSV